MTPKSITMRTPNLRYLLPLFLAKSCFTQIKICHIFSLPQMNGIPTLSQNIRVSTGHKAATDMCTNIIKYSLFQIMYWHLYLLQYCICSYHCCPCKPCEKGNHTLRKLTDRLHHFTSLLEVLKTNNAILHM